jgi:tRNA G10  N-methylase Trm11
MDGSIVVLGRQPALGLAELESLYGADRVAAIGTQAAWVKVDPCLLAFDRLGGSVKFCRPLTTLETTDWKQIEKFLIGVAPGHSERMPEGKMHLGLSLIDFPNVTIQRIMATGLTVKKAINKQTGRTVRLVPNKEAELNTAQVIHNKLITPNGWELVFMRDGDKTVVAQTVKVQDIESYTRRDRERPKRDAKVGMLPPKLAQIIINLAVGQLPDEARQNICEIPPDAPIPVAHFADKYILDPFCGTGVVLQEASLMGYDVQGSDLDPRMVAYTKANLQWLLEQPESRVSIPPENTTGEYARVEVADATNHTWSPMPNVVACETYLGRPFTARPSDEILSQTISECNLIIKKFLRNIHGQLQSGARLCIAVPAWQTGRNSFKHLPLIDQISDLGYNRIRFEHVADKDLLYYREDQIVARQLLVLTRK